MIRRSQVLDPAVKRAWLAVLPRIPDPLRRELAEILRLELAAPTRGAGAEPTGPAPSRRG